MIKWLSKILSWPFWKQNSSDVNSKKADDELYNELGAFIYLENGFILEHKDYTKQIAWNDITKLNVYKADMMTYDRIEMEIVLGEKALMISEELAGWYQFVLKTKEIFPSIPRDWDIDIVFPAFEANYKTIYDKSKTDTSI